MTFSRFQRMPTESLTQTVTSPYKHIRYQAFSTGSSPQRKHIDNINRIYLRTKWMLLASNGIASRFKRPEYTRAEGFGKL